MLGFKLILRAGQATGWISLASESGPTSGGIPYTAQHGLGQKAISKAPFLSSAEPKGSGPSTGESEARRSIGARGRRASGSESTNYPYQHLFQSKTVIKFPGRGVPQAKKNGPQRLLQTLCTLKVREPGNSNQTPQTQEIKYKPRQVAVWCCLVGFFRDWFPLWNCTGFRTNKAEGKLIV